MLKRRRLSTTIATALACAAFAAGTATAFDHPFIGQFHTVAPIGSTVPANGDLNPYGSCRSRAATARSCVATR
jgi:hypothetical protein